MGLVLASEIDVIVHVALITSSEVLIVNLCNY